MNYLTEIKLFYDWLETHPLTPAAISLWHGLMFIANRMGWEEEFTIPLSVLEVRTGMSAATLYGSGSTEGCRTHRGGKSGWKGLR